MPQFLQLLWEKIKYQRGEKRQPTDDAYKPSTDLHSYSYGAVHHHPDSHDMQHRAAEQDYWQEQLRLAEHLNVLTKSLNTITACATVVAGGAALTGFIGLYILNDTLIETREAAKAATKQAHIADQHLTLSERPWVSVDVDATSPLIFDENGARSVLRFTMKNLGDSPAASVRLNFEVLSSWNLQDGFTKRKDICTRLQEQTDSGDFTNTILPKGESRQGGSLRIKKADIDKGTVQFPGLPSMITLAVVGCVDYQFTFAKGHHQTGFFFLIVPRDVGVDILDPTKGPYPARNVGFASIGGSFAY